MPFQASRLIPQEASVTGSWMVAKCYYWPGARRPATSSRPQATPIRSPRRSTTTTFVAPSDLYSVPNAISSQLANAAEAITAWVSSRLREFARAVGVLAKTDRVDAPVPARMGSALALRSPPQPSDARPPLGFSLASQQVVDLRKAEKTRCHNAGQDAIALQIEAMIGLLSRQITELDHAIARLIEHDQTPRAKAAFAEPCRVSARSSSPPFSVNSPNSARSIEAITHRSPASCRMLGKAGHGEESGGSGAVAARSVRPLYRSPRRLTSYARFVAMPDHMPQKSKAPTTILIATARKLLVILKVVRG